MWSWSHKFSVSVFSLSICIFLLLYFCISSCLCEDHTDVCFLYNTRTLSSLSSLCSSASFPNVSFFLYTYVYIFLQLFLFFLALSFALNFIIFICITNLRMSLSNCSPFSISFSCSFFRSASALPAINIAKAAGGNQTAHLMLVAALAAELWQKE